MRNPTISVIAVAFVFGITLLYYYEGLVAGIPTPETVQRFYWLPPLYILVLFVGIAVVGLDLSAVIGAKTKADEQEGKVPLEPLAIVAYVLSKGRYRMIFAITAIVYGLIFSLLTSLIVYQPAVDFTQNPGVQIPSIALVQLFGPPLYAPEIVVFLTNHAGLVLIPFTIILVVTISTLVGINLSLASFAYCSRVRGLGKSWVGGLGAIVGLFTGCPTCAGLIFASTLAGPGAVTLALGLNLYQPLLVALSIPILVVAPYLTLRSLSRVFKEGCVILPKSGRPE